MSRNKLEGYFAGKYGAAYVITRACTKGRRVGRHRPYRNHDREYSLRGAPAHRYEAGDKVFHKEEQRLGTVLDVYGDGVNGHQGDIRLDLSGNTGIEVIEPYNPVAHAEYDHTFIPIKKEWKESYGISKDVPVRD